MSLFWIVLLVAVVVVVASVWFTARGWNKKEGPP